MAQAFEGKILPFRLRLRKAVRAVEATVTPASVMSRIVEGGVVIGTAYLAMKITGLWLLVNAFSNAHNGLLIKSAVIYCFLFPLFYAIGQISLAVLKGLFNLREESNSTQN